MVTGARSTSSSPQEGSTEQMSSQNSSMYTNVQESLYWSFGKDTSSDRGKRRGITRRQGSAPAYNHKSMQVLGEYCNGSVGPVLGETALVKGDSAPGQAGPEGFGTHVASRRRVHVLAPEGRSPGALLHPQEFGHDFGLRTGPQFLHTGGEPQSQTTSHPRPRPHPNRLYLTAT